MSTVPFPEEPLLAPAAAGFGFYPAKPGESLNQSRYTILRKLGFGRYSSTWLVSDSRPGKDESKYQAAKILTVEATNRHHDGTSLEVEILKAIAEDGDVYNLPILNNTFEHSGPHGPHLCLVTDVLSSDVGLFRKTAPKKALPVYMTKIIVAQVAEALKDLHRLNIIHTDIKPDNILFSGVSNDDNIEKIISESPVQVHGEFELEGKRYPAVLSQPIPHKFEWNTKPFIAEIISVVLADLGHAQWANKPPTVTEFTAFALRAPELLLKGEISSAIDIWALGCLTFELLTGRWLFKPEEGEDWRLEDDHFAKMLELTGEKFSEDFLKRYPRSADYFDSAGNLLKISELFPVSLEQAIANYKLLDNDEIQPAATFIRDCIRFDPKDRPTAEALTLHPWLSNAFTPCAADHKHE